MPYAARITVFCRMLYAKPRRGPKSCLSHGMRYWETQPRHTLTFGKSAGKVTPFSVYGVLKFGGNGAFWFLPLGISSVSVWMLKWDYDTAGLGNSTQLVTELLNTIAGIQMTAIGYKGIAPAQ